jgi:hypothetical protein
MDLTPEERQRIYAEEKARIEAQEEIKKKMVAERAAADRIERQRDGSASDKAILAFIAVVVGLIFLYSVAARWSAWFPSVEDTAREKSAAKLSKITASLDSSKETLKERAALYSTADMVEDMQALFEARWRDLEELRAKNKADTSMSKGDKDSLDTELLSEFEYVSDILKSHAEIYYHHRDRIKGRSVQSVTALGKEIKVGDTEAHVHEVLPGEGDYQVYFQLDSGRGSDEAPQYLPEQLYITPDLTLEVTLSGQSRVVRLFVRDRVSVSEQGPQIALGDQIANIAVRGKQLSVGDTPDVASFGLEKKDWLMRPRVESDQQDSKSLEITLYYKVGSKRFAVVLHSGSKDAAYKPKVEAIALLK